MKPIMLLLVPHVKLLEVLKYSICWLQLNLYMSSKTYWYCFEAVLFDHINNDLDLSNHGSHKQCFKFNCVLDCRRLAASLGSLFSSAVDDYVKFYF